MKALDVVLYAVGLIVVFLIATVLVPYLISAKSTALVLLGVGIIVTTVVAVVWHIVKTFTPVKQEEENTSP
jgi:hypothetical protein